MILHIAFTYERLYELPYFNMLERGKNFRKRTNPFFKRWLGSIFYFGADIIAVLQLYLNYKLGRKQGDIFIDYCAPMAITDIVDIKANFSPESKDELFAHKNSIQILGEAIGRKLLETYRLLPMHLVAYAVKQHPLLTRAEAPQFIRDLVARLSGQNRNIASLTPLSEEQILDAGIKQLSVFKALTVHGDVLKIVKPSIVNYFAAAI
jgi:uncharacterized protein YjiS (DUF1127 family)